MSAPQQRCILLVEDDVQVRAFVRMLLASEGYKVLEASTGADGLRRAEEAGGRIDLLLSDVLLPELSGYDLAVQLRARYPDLKVVLMTGYADGDIVQRCLAELNATFVDKPFQPAALRQLVRDALGAS